MDGQGELPDEFSAQVRDGLQHLFDPAYLQTHRLAAYAGASPTDRVASGRLVRQALLDAIQALHPGSSVTTASHAWRAYRILELRYVAGNDVAAVAAQLALSKRQYHREHHRALLAVISLLRERWRSGAAAGDTAPASGIAALVDAAADLAREEARRLAVGERISAVDVAETLRGVRELVRPLCASLGTTIRLDLPVRPTFVSGERVSLRQALLTIVTHALRAAPGATFRVSAQVAHSVVSVSLSGPAIVDAERLRIGVRESATFLEASGGSIVDVSSDSPEGVLAIELTLRAADRPVLLVVDNSDDFIRLVERYLTGYDWQVVGACDADEALTLAHARRPWAILLDAVIPGRDGWDLLLDLKRGTETREIPVVLCSVLDEPDLALSLGAASYLHKPISQSQLVTALSRFR